MAFWREYSRVITTTVVLLLLLTTAGLLGVFKPIHDALVALINPISQPVYNIIQAQSPLVSADVVQLQRDNEQLRQQLAQVSLEFNTIQDQLVDYKDWQEQLAFAHDHELEVVPANVVSAVGERTAAVTLTIDLPANHTVAVGYPVIINRGVLLGFITNVQEHEAQVALITNPSIKVEAKVLNQTTVAGLVTGEYGANVRLNYILPDTTIAVGDVIVTASTDQTIPAGLLIGTVQSLENDSAGLFKTALLSPLAPYGDISIVAVVVPEQPL